MGRSETGFPLPSATLGDFETVGAFTSRASRCIKTRFALRSNTALLCNMLKLRYFLNLSRLPLEGIRVVLGESLRPSTQKPFITSLHMFASLSN